MDMKFIVKIILVLWALILIMSCNDASPSVSMGDPKIISISPTTVHVGDTVTISGKHFGFGIASLQVTLAGNAFVNHNETVSWQNNQIRFRVPDSAMTGNVFVKVGFTLSNGVNLNIINYPPIETVETTPGTFKMGSNTNALEEYPEHEVTITKNLIAAKYEITQRQFSSIMRRNPSLITDLRLPVYNITWLDAVRFCNALSIAQKLDTAYRFVGGQVLWNDNAKGWRLPTEAEWEYLCRAGTTGDFAGTAIINDMCWISDNSGMKPHPVGTKAANQFGLHDMHGNVWEYCWDWYAFDYYASSPSIDPTGPENGSRRVIRGGSYSDGANYARSSNRSIPEILSNNIGFRIVRTK